MSENSIDQQPSNAQKMRSVVTAINQIEATASKCANETLRHQIAPCDSRGDGRDDQASLDEIEKIVI
jgi:hypothetical protein